MTYYEQEKDYTCGVACLRMVLSEFYDEIPSEDELARQLMTNENYGTRTSDLTRVANLYNLEVIEGNDGTLEKLAELSNAGYVILLAISVDVPHFVVYTKHNPVHIFYNDPYFGENTSRRIDKFMSPRQTYPFPRWRIVAEEFKKYLPDHWELFASSQSVRGYYAMKKR